MEYTVAEFFGVTISVGAIATYVTQYIKNKEYSWMEKIPLFGRFVTSIIESVERGNTFEIRSIVVLIAVVLNLGAAWYAAGVFPFPPDTLMSWPGMQQFLIYIGAVVTTVWNATANYTFFVKPLGTQPEKKK